MVVSNFIQVVSFLDLEQGQAAGARYEVWFLIYLAPCCGLCFSRPGARPGCTKLALNVVNIGIKAYILV
jgi:hypothetical protein